MKGRESGMVWPAVYRIEKRTLSPARLGNHEQLLRPARGRNRIATLRPFNLMIGRVSTFKVSPTPMQSIKTDS